MENNKIFFIICLYFVSLTANAQAVIPDMTLNDDFLAQVKSLEEFQNRFNGTEKKPGSVVGNDSLSRVNNLISLFDFQIDKKGINKEQFRNKIYEFVDSVLINHVQFDMISPMLWCECNCLFKYQGKNKHITLILQKESFNNGIYRWAIVSVKGLEKTNIIPEHFYSISPVEHEIYFIGLQDLFNENPSHAFGYRAKSVKIDQLSVLLTLVQTGSIKFDIVEKQTFHYLGVPGYVFTIKEFSRTGQNSGWLISDFKKMNIKEKKELINKMYDYEI